MITLRGIAQPSDCLLTHILLAYWRKLLGCVLTMRGFAMYIKLIAKPLAVALFTVSGSRFDRRVAFGSPREAAFGPSGRSSAGRSSARFRRRGWCSQLHQKR